MGAALSAGCLPRRYDPNDRRGPPEAVADHEDPQPIALADEDEPVFLVRVFRIVVFDGVLVKEHGLCLFE